MVMIMYLRGFMNLFALFRPVPAAVCTFCQWLFMVKVHIYSIICSYCCPRINNNNNQSFLVVPSHYESCVLHDIIYRNRMFSRGLSPLLYHHFFCLFLLVQYQVVGVWEGGKLLSCILSNPAEKWK
jgi:hypothetical protein